MTSREFFTAVIEANVSEEITNFAKERIEKLDDRLARAKENKQSTPSKASIENAELAQQLYPRIEGGTTYTAAELGKLIDVNTSKATSVAKVLVAEGKLDVVEVKQAGKRPIHGYVLK